MLRSGLENYSGPMQRRGATTNIMEGHHRYSQSVANEVMLLQMVMNSNGPKQANHSKTSSFGLTER